MSRLVVQAKGLFWPVALTVFKPAQLNLITSSRASDKCSHWPQAESGLGSMKVKAWSQWLLNFAADFNFIRILGTQINLKAANAGDLKYHGSECDVPSNYLELKQKFH